MNTNLEMEVFTYYKEGTLQIIGSQQTDEPCEQQQTSPHISVINKTFAIHSDVSPHIGYNTHELAVRPKIAFENESDMIALPVWTAGQSYETLSLPMTEWDTS
ncbi:hypothetical protein PP175_01395 [Aneurinibacillus sp. Ricciae_BoGa-3]|uniref:hypothetical protein n=1 Tax=Aneurinibacillus sp. Ricciae_BoGa-3 TaxID=3022697 RepID=UPI0023426527|nr:hypothetical protein [Aneurinibacillus sp. Ricciae_BoGa-3]WCK54723.1 hypothetical protein PP175_01395 [Aneurinibacillus sp. Ricciae_BoGa-3]